MTVHVVETDMRPFEGALDEQWCHIYAKNGNRGLCGHEFTPGDATHVGTWDTERCDGCGRRNCPECRRVVEQSL